MYLLEDPEEISGWYSVQHLFYLFVCEICPSTDVGDEQGQEETGRNATCVPVIVKEQTVFTDILQERGTPFAHSEANEWEQEEPGLTLIQVISLN